MADLDEIKVVPFPLPKNFHTLKWEWKLLPVVKGVSIYDVVSQEKNFFEAVNIVMDEIIKNTKVNKGVIDGE